MTANNKYPNARSQLSLKINKKLNKCLKCIFQYEIYQFHENDEVLHVNFKCFEAPVDEL